MKLSDLHKDELRPVSRKTGWMGRCRFEFHGFTDGAVLVNIDLSYDEDRINALWSKGLVFLKPQTLLSRYISASYDVPYEMKGRSKVYKDLDLTKLGRRDKQIAKDVLDELEDEGVISADRCEELYSWGLKDVLGDSILGYEELDLEPDPDEEYEAKLLDKDRRRLQKLRRRA